ncbi:PREDICTED: E3 ubiquitin-protein ligase SINAT3-like [Nicrophorus vespilloides]|uniref:RING-type E3 ubiquitin transferase n=1 Tax=Nicrophorus vespilloides TaxID=110193 RepID=A0ABM1MHA3_NICVS|nr:PREDICTED: E3 ubiquitin-protein ligase SINAT3-like [Nicrophorus vespilloides]
MTQMDETLAILDHSLLQELECPVCTEIMHPPIKQCITGHSFCSLCYMKLRKCPTCRQQLSTTARSYALERLHSKLVFRCMNRDEGCDIIDYGKNILEHQQICCYGAKRCPLQVINDCQWTGHTRDMVDHCKAEHPNNIFITKRQRLTCSNFSKCHAATTSYFYIIFYAHNEFFKCAWQVNFDTGFMRWCVFKMNHSKKQNYHFQIEIENQNQDGDRLVVNGKCPELKTEQQDVVFNNKQFLITHYDMIKGFCKNTDLIYIVNIIKDEDL